MPQNFAQILKVEANPAHAPLLRVEVQLHYHGREAVYVHLSQAQLHLGGVPFSPISLELHRRYLKSGEHERISFSFAVAPYLWKAVETARAAGDVHLSMHIGCLVTAEKNPTEPLDQQTFSTQTKLSAAEWLELSHQLGYANKRLIEIQLPVMVGGGAFVESSEALEKAWGHLKSGRNEEAVAACRKAFEVVQNVLTSSQANLAQVFDLGSTHPEKERKKSDRIEELRKSLRALLQIGPHAGYRISRPEAEACVLTTSALLGLYSESLSPKEF